MWSLTLWPTAPGCSSQWAHDRRVPSGQEKPSGTPTLFVEQPTRPIAALDWPVLAAQASASTALLTGRRGEPSPGGFQDNRENSARAERCRVFLEVEAASAAPNFNTCGRASERLPRNPGRYVMSPHPSLLRLLTIVLLIGSGSALRAQCVNRTEARSRFAAATPPALGNSVSYTLGNRYFSDADFDFGGYACTNQSQSPAVSYSENTTLSLFGSQFSYGCRSLASAAGWAFILVDLTTPTGSTTLASSVGASGIAAILPAVTPRSEAFTAGTMQIGLARLTIRPTVTFRADPATRFEAVGRSRSANLNIAIGIESTLAYSQRVFFFGAPVDATLSGKAQDIFVSGFTNATSSSTAAAVRGNYTLRDDGSNLSFRVTWASGLALSNINWSRPSGWLPGVNF